MSTDEKESTLGLVHIALYLRCRWHHHDHVEIWNGAESEKIDDSLFLRAVWDLGVQERGERLTP